MRQKDFLRVRIGEVPRLVRVNGHRGVNPIVALGDCEGRVQAIGARASSRYQNVAKAGGAGARDHCRAVSVEIRIIKMGVRIDKELIH